MIDLENPELLVLTALASALPDVRLCTELPTSLDQIPRTVQPVRAGGGKILTLSTPRMVVHSWANGGPAAVDAVRELASEVDAAMLALRGTTVQGVCFTWIDQMSGPSAVRDQNPQLRHMVATYSLSLTLA